VFKVVHSLNTIPYLLTVKQPWLQSLSNKDSVEVTVEIANSVPICTGRHWWGSERNVQKELHKIGQTLDLIAQNGAEERY